MKPKLRIPTGLTERERLAQAWVAALEQVRNTAANSAKKRTLKARTIVSPVARDVARAVKAATTKAHTNGLSFDDINPAELEAAYRKAFEQVSDFWSRQLNILDGAERIAS